MSIQNNNITIFPISGYSPSFNWQVGFSNSLSIPTNNLTFRATVRPINGLENFTRVPNSTIYYEETGIIINNATNGGQWTFPLGINASLTGGPYRDYQVIIEAHDSEGNTSAGNLVNTTDEQGWTRFNQGYDIIAISNPRQTGIEMSNNLKTQVTSTNTATTYNSGHGYHTLNYMGTHGEINIRYLSGQFNSNLVGGYIYAWTGQFPKLETALRISGFNQVTKSQFTFDPTVGYVYHPTAAMAFRGSNHVYVSLSFYDNLDQEAIDNGIIISTGLYLSDNAICYNDISAGSISIGGNQSIYSLQYTGSSPATGILGTGATILATQFFGGNTSVLYLSNPIMSQGFSAYTGISSSVGGGGGGNSILLNNIPLNSYGVNSFIVNLSATTDDSLSIYLNGRPIKDDAIMFPSDATSFNILTLAAASGYLVRFGDTVTFSGKDTYQLSYYLPSWTGKIIYNDMTVSTFTGGLDFHGTSDGTIYRNDGFIIVGRN